MADDEMADMESGFSDMQDTAVSSLTGFLFGNIDEKGELEGDFFDEVQVISSFGLINLLVLCVICKKVVDHVSTIWLYNFANSTCILFC